MYIADPEENLDLAIRKVKGHLLQGGYETLVYDDIYLTVSNDSNEDDIVIIYQLKRRVRELAYRLRSLEN